MKLLSLILTLVVASEVSFAHCPLEININGTSYCTDIKWTLAQLKVSGQLTDSTESSPILIESGTIPPKWLYSKAQFTIWKNGDSQHVPQEIAGLRIFPYMHMSNGHHHSTSYEFAFNAETGVYQIEKVALTEMDGCWSLRWTVDATDTLETSQLLLNITSFTNTAENMSALCKASSDNSNDGHEHH